MVDEDNIRANRRSILKFSLIAGLVGTLPTAGRVEAQEGETLLSPRPWSTVDTRQYPTLENSESIVPALAYFRSAGLTGSA